MTELVCIRRGHDGLVAVFRHGGDRLRLPLREAERESLRIAHLAMVVSRVRRNWGRDVLQGDDLDEVEKRAEPYLKRGEEVF